MNSKTYLTQEVDELLRRESFRRKGITWNRINNGSIDVVSIQPASYTTPSEYHLTINFGILFFDVWALAWGLSVPEFVKEVDCFPRARIGQLTASPDGKRVDRWWTLHGDDRDSVKVSEIKSLIEEVGPAFFEDRATIEKSLKLAMKDQSASYVEKFYQGVMYVISGDTSSALDLFEIVCEGPEEITQNIDRIKKMIKFEHGQ